MKLDAYIRVSRVGGREGNSFISPDVQRDQINGYAKLHKHRIVRWHEDMDESGGKEDRPGFQAALARAERGDTEGIIVAKLDRFARSVPDAAKAIKRLDAAGAVLISVNDQLDTSTPMGKFARTMMLAIAELEYDRITESWATARERAVMRGIHPVAYAPTGYRKAEDGGPLILDPAAAPVIKEAFQMRAEGKNYGDIARHLRDSGLCPSGRDTPVWRQNTVAKLLQNPVYVGTAYTGRFRKADAHPAVVSASEFAAAQHRRAPTPLRTDVGSPLSGLVRCAGCRKAMQHRGYRQGGHERKKYVCRNASALHGDEKCPAPASTVAEHLEELVEAEFFKALEPDGALARQVPAESGADAGRRLKEAREALAWWATDLSSAIERDAYLAGIQARQEAVEEAEALVAAASPGIVLPDLVSLKDEWPTMTRAEKRALYAAAIQAVFLRQGSTRQTPLRDRLLIVWTGEPLPALPLRGQPKNGERRVLEPVAW